MAAAYIRVYFKGEYFRTFGGNKKDVKEMKKRYESDKNYRVEYVAKNH